MTRNLFNPLQAEIFSLLAFYIASAAFRAFRVRNVEATLLLVAAFIVMLGRTPLGEYAFSWLPGGQRWLPAVTDWIMAVPNTAAQRGIIIGAALGAASLSLRVILGIERSYLGMRKRWRRERRTRVKLERLINIDRRIVYLLIAIYTVLPILFPIGFSVSTTPPVENLFEKIETLGPRDAVMVSFDYGPTTMPENGPMAEAVLRHCFSRGVKVVGIALFPIGGVTMAGQTVAKVTAEFPELQEGVDFVNLGYEDGAQAAMKQMGVAIVGVFPADHADTPTAELPLMQRVRSSADISLVVSLATGVIGGWWANLINAQFGIPVAVGCTAVSTPKYCAFIDSGQMLGLLGGLKGASEYERLLLDRFPELRATYQRRGSYTAMKGMDAQTVDHAIIMVFILFGNTVYFLSRRRERRAQQS